MFRILPALLAAALLAVPIASVGASLTATPSLGHLAPEGRVPTDLVVGFRGALPRDVDAWAATWGARIDLRDEVLAWARLHFPTQALADAVLPKLAQDPRVRYAEHDTYVEALVTPNDALWGQQWGPPAIQAPAAWDLTMGSHAVKLAILDTGMHFAHPDLAANLCGPHASFIPGQTVDDGFGHGTHVASTAAGVTGNGIGVAGISQSCIMVVKVLGNNGFSQGTSVAAGIRWAADNGADIESMSLGRTDFLQATADAVKYAYERDVLLVAAAGNNGCPATAFVPFGTGVPPVQSQGSMGYPAFHDEVLAVAALTAPGTNTAGFSSCGPDMEIAAPGANVISALPPCTGGVALCSNTGYGSLDGTSMATPHVAGVAALVLSQNLALSAVELRCILDLSADDTALDTPPAIPIVPGRDYKTGWGRVNARAALDLDATLTANGLHAAFAEACAQGKAAIFE